MAETIQNDDIIFDIVNDRNINPNILFDGLKFRLKKFDFEKDKLFSNMTQLKKSDDISERVMNLIRYEFNYDNILDKIKELFPDNIVDICDDMFIQLYLYLIQNKDINQNKDRFIYKRTPFQSFDSPNMKSSFQSTIDKKTNMCYIMYLDNYKLNRLLSDVKCFYDHIDLIKTGTDKDGYACYTGLTPTCIKTMNIINWANYLKSSCKDWIDETKKISDIEYESDSRELCKLTDENELMKSINIYSRKKNLLTLKNYYIIGYFDIWEFSNSETKFAINTNNNMIIDIKD